MSCSAEYIVSPEKRWLDVVGSVLIGACLSPAVGAAAAILKREIGVPWGRMILQQTRFDPKRRSLDVFKLLTFVAADGPMQTFGTFDPRAGKWGRMIRQVGLDESLQLWNVIRGDMTLVGPRPLPEVDLQLFENADSALFDEWRIACGAMRPGLCGPSQVFRHSQLVTTPEVRVESMRLDLGYAENASLGLDLRILATTPFDLLWAATQARNSAPQPIHRSTVDRF